MASPTRWAWVWVDYGSLWWTGRHGVLWFMGSQRVGRNWVTELNWNHFLIFSFLWHLLKSILFYFLFVMYAFRAINISQDRFCYCIFLLNHIKTEFSLQIFLGFVCYLEMCNLKPDKSFHIFAYCLLASIVENFYEYESNLYLYYMWYTIRIISGVNEEDILNFYFFITNKN